MCAFACTGAGSAEQGAQGGDIVQFFCLVEEARPVPRVKLDLRPFYCRGASSSIPRPGMIEVLEHDPYRDVGRHSDHPHGRGGRERRRRTFIYMDRFGFVGEHSCVESKEEDSNGATVRRVLTPTEKKALEATNPGPEMTLGCGPGAQCRQKRRGLNASLESLHFVGVRTAPENALFYLRKKRREANLWRIMSPSPTAQH